MSYRCKHCLNGKGILINGIKIIYCEKRSFHPSPNFIKAYGCDDYEDSQLSLFKKEVAQNGN